jgi:hypothetical protein
MFISYTNEFIIVFAESILFSVNISIFAMNAFQYTRKILLFNNFGYIIALRNNINYPFSKVPFT